MATTTANDGTELHHEATEPVEGATPAILVHGITERAEAWDPIVERLAPSRQVVTVDLRGHGRSGDATTYDLASMAADVVAVADARGIAHPHLVGHSLGGVVVTVAGGVSPVASVVDVDQSLALGAFRDQLVAIEDQLRDPGAFPEVMEAVLSSLETDRLPDAERRRLEGLRAPRRDVVLGVWDVVLTSGSDELDDLVDTSLAGWAGRDTPHLTVFGSEPGDDYEAWLRDRIPGATVEVRDGDGHHLHLVDPDRFVERLERWWAEVDAAGG